MQYEEGGRETVKSSASGGGCGKGRTPLFDTMEKEREEKRTISG